MGRLRDSLYTGRTVSDIRSVGVLQQRCGVMHGNGAMCQAQKLDLRITHSLCISREDTDEEFKILTACGICQERLRYWGENVKVAVTNPENKIIFKTLAELSPCYWGEAFPKEEREEYDNR